MIAFLSSPARRPFRRLVVLLVAASCICQVGCVRRRLTIRSRPAGARVYVDDHEIGTTPVSHKFTYYGGRKIRLVKDGYETLTTDRTIRMPWYQVPPLDFFSENVVPVDLHDQHTLDFTLQPQVVVPSGQLLGRAEELRRQARQGAAAGPAVPAMQGGAPRVMSPTRIPTSTPPQPMTYPASPLPSGPALPRRLQTLPSGGRPL